ncbi:flagellar type III secretion system pore protein FliP [Lentisphaerota bacterium WC36G]
MNLSLTGGQSFGKAVNILLLITALSLAPAAIMLMTSFTRIVIVLSFLRQALSVQNVPSAKIISAIALFMTIFIMQPVWSTAYNDAIKPFNAKEISQEEAMIRAIKPFKNFMLRQTRDESLLLFMEMSEINQVEAATDLPMHIIIPAFIVSELKTAFQMGFLIFLPFLVIDIIVASTLMSLGMMMLPPTMIALPFKLLLFVIIDGWTLMIKSLVLSFN